MKVMVSACEVANKQGSVDSDVAVEECQAMTLHRAHHVADYSHWAFRITLP